MFHVAGGARIFSTTLAGGRHVVIPRFEPGPFLKTLEAEGVTITIIVPTMLARLVREPALSTTDLSALKLLTYGASPMPEALLREAMAKLPGVRFLQSYGMTELSPVATVLTPEYHAFEGPKAGKTASAGQPAYNADVVVLGPDDSPVPRGRSGRFASAAPWSCRAIGSSPNSPPRPCAVATCTPAMRAISTRTAFFSSSIA
jgi:long-chain acyl-CoA synthetase